MPRLPGNCHQPTGTRDPLDFGVWDAGMGRGLDSGPPWSCSPLCFLHLNVQCSLPALDFSLRGKDRTGLHVLARPDWSARPLWVVLQTVAFFFFFAVITSYNMSGILYMHLSLHSVCVLRDTPHQDVVFAFTVLIDLTKLSSKNAASISLPPRRARGPASLYLWPHGLFCTSDVNGGRETTRG